MTEKRIKARISFVHLPQSGGSEVKVKCCVIGVDFLRIKAHRQNTKQWMHLQVLYFISTI